MRKFILFSFLLIAILASDCGNKTGKNAADPALKQFNPENVRLVFEEYEHDFGKVTEGEKVGYVFVFENKGTEDLVITSATTSCGCTVPEYDRKPVPPGGKGNLEVVFDTSGKSGTQTKTISVRSNSSVPVILLKITAEVVSTINN